MTTSSAAIGLDIGHRRIGVAVAPKDVRIASPYLTLEVDGREIDRIAQIFGRQGAEVCVIGLPRNQSGQETAQSKYTRKVAKQIEAKGIKIAWQDESLTSVQAEAIIADGKSGGSKAEVDAVAASLILQDYLEGLGA